MMSSPSPEEIYKSLHEIFYTRKSNEIFEIEILSAGQGPLLRDGPFVGITKSALAKAFIVARKHFLQHVARLNENNSLSIEEEKEFVAITEVILLFDCEYITACNWRKRLVRASIDKYIAEGDIRHRKSILDILERELNFITTFVCSPLHRHTKSPTLWQHRLWIMTERLKLENSAMREGGTLFSTEAMHNFMLAELSIVCRAGELHPKNYYAFSYLRQLHSAVSNPATRISADSAVGVSNLLYDIAAKLVKPTLKWCLSNPKDISGWMFLIYLLSHDAAPGTGEQDIVELRKFAVERTIHFAMHITAWKGESLWTFVDLMITRFGTSVLPETISINLDQTEPNRIKDLIAFADTSVKGLPSATRWMTTMHRTRASCKDIRSLEST